MFVRICVTFPFHCIEFIIRGNPETWNEWAILKYTQTYDIFHIIDLRASLEIWLLDYYTCIIFEYVHCCSQIKIYDVEKQNSFGRKWKNNNVQFPIHFVLRSQPFFSSSQTAIQKHIEINKRCRGCTYIHIKVYTLHE